MVVVLAVLHQHLEIHQVLGLLAQPGELVDARALEDEPPAVKVLVVSGAVGRAVPIAGGVAILDALLYPALLPGTAAGLAAHGRPRGRVADATLRAGVVTPKLLAEPVEAALKDTAALGLGDALASVQHEALLALAGLHAGRGTAVGRHRGVVAGSGAGAAARRVVAVLRAGQGC